MEYIFETEALAQKPVGFSTSRTAMIPLDAISVIHLPHREDRKASISADLSRAVKENVIPPVPVEYSNHYPVNRTLVPASWPHYASYWAATREHEEVLNDLWAKGSKLALILEDDAYFLPSFYTELVPFYDEIAAHFPDWLALFLGGRDVYGFEARSERVALNRGSVQSHAYIVNVPGMWRLRDHLWCSQFQIVDWAYAGMMREDACVYRPVNWLVSTRAGWSNNRNGFAAEGE